MDYADYSDYAYETTTTGDAAGAGVAALFGGVWMLFWLAVAVASIIGMYKIFTKAGKPGWAAIVPIYNTVILHQIVGRPVWWVILYFIPFVNIIISVLVAIDLAKSFGKDEIFGIVALWLFSIVGYLMLGFGNATYKGPAGPDKSGASRPAAPAKAA